ncbi:DNA helicase II [Escherichia coli]|nr:DNA helicase II [Escherichia coli]
MRDILRAHLFPEVTVKQNSQIKIMDIQQEILARILVTGIVSFMVWPVPEKP